MSKTVNYYENELEKFYITNHRKTIGISYDFII